VLQGGPTGGRALTYRIGGRNTNATFSGTISEQNTGTATSYVKTGTGIWTLSGSGNWNGGTTVEQGTLKLSGPFSCAAATTIQTGSTLQLANGSLSTDALNISTGATLTGNGTITGDLNNDGTVTSTIGGTLAVTGDVVNNGTMRIASGTALSATGNFVNNGILDLLTSSAGLPPNLENNGIVIDSSTLRTTSVSKVGNVVTLKVPTHTGHTYQLQRSSSLSSGWTDLGASQSGLTTVSGTPTERTFTDSGATFPKYFYRIRVTP
jgi:autotransporter-associated beta strand protein